MANTVNSEGSIALDVLSAREECRSAHAALVDVRGFDEFFSGHAEGAICIPLQDLPKRASELPAGETICVMCQSGARSAMAAKQLADFGFGNVRDVTGGYSAWRSAGLPCVIGRRAIPLERQVRGIAGFLVLASTLGGLTRSKWLFGVPVFVGFMLFLSGVTGLCPMISLLKVMPWNRTFTTGDRSL